MSDDNWKCDRVGCLAEPGKTIFTRIEVAGRMVTLCEKHWKERTAQISKNLQSRSKKFKP
jgi:hypothetical protein